MEEGLRKLLLDVQEASSGEEDSVFPDLRFQTDELGNMTVTVEDGEGNLVSEVVEELAPTLSEDIRASLLQDRFRGLPRAAKALVCASLTSSRDTSLVESPFLARHQNRAVGLAGSVGQFWGGQTVATSTPVQEEAGDEVEGRRRASSSAQPIERLLYPHRFRPEVRDSFHEVRTEISLSGGGRAQAYTATFPALRSSLPLQDMGGASPPAQPAEGAAFAPLTLILQTSVLAPLRVQARLADSALLTHLLVDCRVADHLAALRSYLFLADGEFGRQLVLSLCQLGGSLQRPSHLASQLHSHLTRGAPPPHILSPTSLNRVLDLALGGSQDPLSSHLTFQLEPARPAAQRSLGIPGLSLSYQPPWPATLVLTQEAVAQYSLVTDFLLELRLAATSLELDWVSENLVLRREGKGDPGLLHRVAVMRHEMVNFLRNLQGYVVGQVLEVSWAELHDCLASKVHCLDDLLSQHDRYLHRVVFRCLLNSKAAPVMKIITDIFGSITRFSGLVREGKGSPSGEVWTGIEKQYSDFSIYSRFLYSVVGKLLARGYQPHLQDLLLRLNFNGYYD